MKSLTPSSQEILLTWNSLIAKGDLVTIQLMVDKGELSYKDQLGEYGLSPLHLAAWLNQPNVCQFLISHKISPSVKESFSGKSPLHIASYFGYLEVADILLGLGAKVTENKGQDKLGCLPMHYAALGEQKNMIFRFLEIAHSLGSNESTVSPIGNVLDILIRKRNFDLCDLISSSVGISIVETNRRRESAPYVGYSNQWTPFHSAAALGDKKIIEMLIHKFSYAHCFSKDSAMFDKYSPSLVASIQGNTKIAQVLGDIGSLERYPKAFYIPSSDAPGYARDLLQAVLERDFDLLDKLVGKYGEDILYQPYFKGDNYFYESQEGLNTLSLVSRLFCFSFAEWAEKRALVISPLELLDRDLCELVFLNWLLVDLHPYATGFFKKVGLEIAQLT